MSAEWERIGDRLYRMTVPGGSIYRHASYMAKTADAMVFVPEPAPPLFQSGESWQVLRFPDVKVTGIESDGTEQELYRVSCGARVDFRVGGSVVVGGDSP